MNSEQLQHLNEVARRWLGTPFSANACTPGLQGGVSCQALAAAIYIELGVLPIDAEIPAGRINRGRFNKESEIVPWVNGRPEFRPQALIDQVQAGDLLGFRIGNCVSHVGVALSPEQFIHCLARVGVHISSVHDATWSSRLWARWTPQGGDL